MPEPEEIASHHTSLAVWDTASPVIIGHRATLKIGIACPSGCSLTGTSIEVRDENGATIGSGRVGSTPWPGTTALYWVELDVAAPEVEGDHAWSIHATTPEPSHDDITSRVRFVASRRPDQHVRLDVIDKGSRVPVSGVELRLGSFRATTNTAGGASVDVPGGTYEVSAWKIGYELLATTALISDNTTLRLELMLTVEPEQPYWM